MKKYLLDRELSWLNFNKRVLDLSQSKSVSLKDRLFLYSITHSNLDEFFQIRISGLIEQLDIGEFSGFNDNISIDEFNNIFDSASKYMKDRVCVWNDELKEELSEFDLSIKTMDQLTKSEKNRLKDYFINNVMPSLTPLASDQTKPFPYISDLSLSIGIFLKKNKRKEFVRIKIPTNLGAYCNVNFNEIVWMHDLVMYFAEVMFTSYQIEEKFWFRITRDQDLEFRQSLKKDFLEVVKEGLEFRRQGKVSRVEIQNTASNYARNYLKRKLELDLNLFVDLSQPLTAFQINSLQNLRDFPTSWKRPTGEFSFGGDVFDILKKKDVLVQHPYDSFEQSVIKFLETACKDTKVITIKMTQYRTGNSAENDVITSLLATAARLGKQVAVQIELRARFDEEKNIKNAQYLEDAGVHVTYGDPQYKAHVKMILVVREEEENLVSYMHFGTGNYNFVTSQGYEDIGLFTSNESLGEDCGLIFNSLTAYANREFSNNILVAPEKLQDSIIDLIKEQKKLKDEGYIFLKLNNITDPFIIEALNDASKAGVQIDIIVRGICSLKPSRNIRIKSILGQFLEHSRIYSFGKGARKKIFIGSADMMQRNLRHRIEILVPILNSNIKKKLEKIILKYLKTDKFSWSLDKEGNWHLSNGDYSIQEDFNRL
jgi:polyphosphate kinase